jgi:uncharacterized protein (TIGR03437 family)
MAKAFMRTPVPDLPAALKCVALMIVTGLPYIQGQMLLLREFTSSVIDRAAAVSVTASSIYVAGVAKNGVAAGIQKFETDGNYRWTKNVDLSAAGGLTIDGIAADATSIHVWGHVRNASFEREAGFLARYTAAGEEVWTKRLQRFGAVAVNATGVYVASSKTSELGALSKYNSEGAELWAAPLGGATGMFVPFELEVDSTGVYVFGAAVYDEEPSRLAVRKHDLQGTHLWTRELPRDLYMPTYATTETTGFYAAALQFDGGIYLHKFDSDGNQVWSRRVASWSDAGPIGLAYAAADATGVYIAGSLNWAASTLPGNCRSGAGGDSFLRKYSYDGAEEWSRQFAPADGSLATGLALGGGRVYVVGQSGAAPFWDDAGVPAAFATEDRTSRGFLAAFHSEADTSREPGPRVMPGCVVNAASYVGGGVAPGEIVTLFGSGLGPTELVQLQIIGGRRLSSRLGDTRVRFDGIPAPLLYVSDKQASAVVPYGIAGRTEVDIQIEHKGLLSEAVRIPVLPSRPGIFTLNSSGRGQAAILNEDGTINSPANPAARGSAITIFATGGGETDPRVRDGQIVRDSLPKTTLPVSVSVGLGTQARLAEILYAGGVRGSVAGLLQLNVRIPPDVWPTSDAVPLLLRIGSQWTAPQATVALR